MSRATASAECATKISEKSQGIRRVVCATAQAVGMLAAGYAIYKYGPSIDQALKLS